MTDEKQASNLDFFNDLVLNISSSLELAKAWKSTFHFLAKQVPIEAICLHRFVPELKSFQISFLVTKGHYYELDELIALTEAETAELKEQEDELATVYFSNSKEDSVCQKLDHLFSAYLVDRERAYLAGLLRTEQEIIGHLCLLGSGVGCFTDEHKHKFELMLAPVGLAMMNMQQYRQTQELRQRLDEQRSLLAGEVNLLKESSIIGAKGGLHDTMEVVRQLAGKEAQVLLLGETGTGKELFADAVQQISSRVKEPYIKVNCGAIPESLVDSELFGYQKGAFTGATSNRAGRFEQANGGTLFLDEVGELPLPVQVRLLRVLQNGTIERVGGARSIPVDVRIIAATNRPLEAMVKEGAFREDLYYRLNVFPIRIPPLRERIEDIPLLVHHFIQQASKKLKLSNEVSIDSGEMEMLQAYSWPGNVRELENLVERAITLSPHGPLRLAKFLPQDSVLFSTSQKDDNYFKKLIREQIDEALSGRSLSVDDPQPVEKDRDEGVDLSPLDDVIARHIENVLEYCRGKVSGPGGAAEILQVNHNTLRRRMEKLNIRFGYKK